MHRVPKSLILALMVGLTLGGCLKKEGPSQEQIPVSAQPGSTSTPAVSEPSPILGTSAPASGFDINKVPVVNPQLGKFPYFGLIEGYRRSGHGDDNDVDFDRYVF